MNKPHLLNSPFPKNTENLKLLLTYNKTLIHSYKTKQYTNISQKFTYYFQN